MTNAAAADSILQLIIFAQTMDMGMTIPFQFPSQYKTCSLALFLTPNLGKMAVRVVLWPLGLATRVFYVSLTSENTRKMGGLSVYRVLGSHLCFCLVTARSASCQRTIRTVYVPGSDKSL